jgi:hypothetical protein
VSAPNSVDSVPVRRLLLRLSANRLVKVNTPGGMVPVSNWFVSVLRPPGKDSASWTGGVGGGMQAMLHTGGNGANGSRHAQRVAGGYGCDAILVLPCIL